MAEDADGQMKLDFGRTADRIYINAKTSVTLMGNAGGGGGKTGLYLLPVYTIAGNVIGRNEKNGGHQLGVNQDIAPTLTGADRHAVAYAAGFLPKAGAKAGGIGYTEEASPTLMSQHRPAVVYGYTQSGYGEFKEGVGTLKKSRGAAGGGSETLAVIMERIAAAVKYRVRRLTPLECERLDGFPDEWTRYGASGKEMSDNARYMALGNSIAVPCAERVFIGIKKGKQSMTNLEVFLLIVVLLILIGGGVILYLALAGLAIIYSMGANESPRGRRIFFGVLGVVMIVAFVCASIYFHKYGWPL